MIFIDVDATNLDINEVFSAYLTTAAAAALSQFPMALSSTYQALPVQSE